MRFKIFGPFTIPRENNNSIDFKKESTNLFWDSVAAENPDLLNAVGCYVYCLRNGRGSKPWYVGKAERQTFKKEVTTSHKLVKYHSAVKDAKGTPIIYFYAKITPNDKFSKPSAREGTEISYLEKLLISFAIKRNKEILNIKETKILKEMIVPGLINSGSGRLPPAASEIREIMGY